MKVSTKLYGAVAALILIGVTSAAIGSIYTRMMGRELDESINKTAVKLDLVNSMRARGWEMVATMRGTLVFKTFKDQAKVEQNVAQWHAARSRMAELFAEMRPLLVTERGKELLANLESATADYEPMALEYMQLASQGRFAEMRPLGEKVSGFVTRIDQLGKEFRQQELNVLEAANRDSVSSQRNSMVVSSAVSIGLVVIGIFATLAVRGISRSLTRIASDIRSGACQVAEAAGQVSTASQCLAQGATEQAPPSNRPPRRARKSALLRSATPRARPWRRIWSKSRWPESVRPRNGSGEWKKPWRTSAARVTRSRRSSA
jgi:methyl-accepting chemotaxis protein